MIDVRKKLIRMLRGVLWFCIPAAVGLLAFSYLLPQDLSDVSEPYATLAAISFFGRVFTFHLGICLVLGGGLAILLCRRVLGTAGLVVGIVALTPTLLHQIPRNPPSPAGPTWRVMSMNLKYDNHDSADIRGNVRRFDPAIIAIEDYAAYPKRALDSALAGDYPHRLSSTQFGIGLAIYSRVPFVEPPVMTVNKVRRQIRAVVLLSNRPVVFYVIHTYSPRSKRRILATRLASLDLAAQVSGESLPTILAGDFNFTPETPNQTVLTDARLADCFDLTDIGRGSTWPVRPRWVGWLPGVRIDHVFISPELACAKMERGLFDGSDHLPIMAEIGFAK